MEFAEVLRQRRMVRHYLDQPVDPEVVDRVIAAGLRAPSAGYSQGYALLVLESAEDRAKFWAVTDTPQETASWPAETRAGVMRAPVIAVALSCKRVYLDRYATGGQGLDRPRRGTLAGAVLAHRHRHGRAADVAAGRRRGSRRTVHRDAAGGDPGVPRGVRRARTITTWSESCASGTPIPTRRSETFPPGGGQLTTSCIAATGDGVRRQLAGADPAEQLDELVGEPHRARLGLLHRDLAARLRNDARQDGRPGSRRAAGPRC